MRSDSEADGLPDWWEAHWADQFAVYPDALSVTLTHRETVTQSLYLNNPVSPDAEFTVTLTNHLAGTQVEYDYEDSLSGGVSYHWTEISATGTELSAISEHDNAAEELALAHFVFPFYGVSYDRVYVASNGLLTFGSGSTDSGNDPSIRLRATGLYCPVLG